MRRIRQRRPEAESLDLFDALARRAGYRIGNPAHYEKFISQLLDALQRASANPVVVHGRRAQTMFGYLAAALGQCRLLREEDVGEIYSSEPVSIPDYRIVLKSGTQFFVEVKNCNRAGERIEVRFRPRYLDALENYCRLFGSSLRIAVYWARLRLWTLVSSERIPLRGKWRSLTLSTAAMLNEMADLGDVMIGTKPPLAIRILIDPSKKRSIVKRGPGRSTVAFTIGGIELYCGGIRIDDPAEQQLAYYFLLHSGWPDLDPQSIERGGELIAIEFVKSPEERSGHEFDILGYLSSMISDAYADVTVQDGKVIRLSPRLEPEAFAILIDPEYRGEHLPLWRFTQRPNYEG